jgi:hypothetical protein
MVEEFPTDGGDRRVARQQQTLRDNPLSITNRQQFAEALIAMTVMTQVPGGQEEGRDRPGQLIPGLSLAELPARLRETLQSNEAGVVRTREGVGAIFSDLIARRTTFDQGANALFDLGRNAIPFLVAGLNSEDFRVREASQAALRRFGPQGSEALIDAALDQDCPVELRNRARTLLAQGGEVALAPLLRNLSSNRHEVRLGALQAIDQLGLTREALPALFRRMDDPNSSDELREQLEKFIVSSNSGSRYIADGQGRLRYILDPNNTQILAAINYRGNEIHSIHANGRPIVRREANGTYSLLGRDGNWHNDDGLTTAVSVEVRGEDVMRLRHLNRQGRARLVQDVILGPE